MEKHFDYIWSLATKKDRVKLLLVMAATILIPFFELFGIGAVFSFITIVTDPDIINSSEWAVRLKDMLSIEGERNFLVVYGVGVFLVFVVRNFFMAFYVWFRAWFGN